MEYENLFSKSLPCPVAMPEGLREDTKYIFSVTYTDPDSTDYETLGKRLQVALAHEGRNMAEYPPPQGHLGMRELIADNLRQNRGAEIKIESIFLSSGAGGAIQSILDVFIDPGDIVLVEEYSYLGTMRMLLSRGAEVIHIPTDESGMDTDILEKTISSFTKAGRHPKMIYTISVYQNPMGVTLSLDRRKKMVEISQKYGVPILENESYADFRIDGAPLPPAMLGMDAQNSVMYVSAYTKLLGCGLRLGYGVVPDQVRETLDQLNYGTSPSHLSSLGVYEFLRNNKEAYLTSVVDSLRAKRDAMLSALGEYFPPTCSWSQPNGGMMIWVRLPPGADTWKALKKAIDRNVIYNPGPVFRANRDGHNYLRLTYSHNTPEEIRKGVAILAAVFEEEGFF